MSRIGCITVTLLVLVVVLFVFATVDPITYDQANTNNCWVDDAPYSQGLALKWESLFAPHYTLGEAYSLVDAKGSAALVYCEGRVEPLDRNGQPLPGWQ